MNVEINELVAVCMSSSIRYNFSYARTSHPPSLLQPAYTFYFTR